MEQIVVQVVVPLKHKGEVNGARCIEAEYGLRRFPSCLVVVEVGEDALYMCHFPQCLSEIVDRVENDIVRRAIGWQPQLAHSLQDTEGEEVEEALKDVTAGGVQFSGLFTFEDGDVLAPHAPLEVRVAKLIAAGAVGEAKGEVAFAMNLIMYLTAV